MSDCTFCGGIRIVKVEGLPEGSVLTCPNCDMPEGKYLEMYQNTIQGCPEKNIELMEGERDD